jgi:hypothetical protein
VLQTSTGRRYLILRTRGGDFGGPQKLKVQVMDPKDEVPEDARVFEFIWDERKKA